MPPEEKLLWAIFDEKASPLPLCPYQSTPQEEAEILHELYGCLSASQAGNVAW
ncbi:hypothetical protein [Entomobacter blattae]|uniref:Uncharacterized protein n=1 Tax=Entomobacter blattae TaxID=2762277 RepID=A0A7H1NS13_9PROT|nr:hypothetical protein [Entomobacter blattae]QNT78573.1 hypothetical protein JGUZn3_13470 [Entomobacter blattae]